MTASGDPPAAGHAPDEIRLSALSRALCPSARAATKKPS